MVQVKPSMFWVKVCERVPGLMVHLAVLAFLLFGSAPTLSAQQATACAAAPASADPTATVCISGVAVPFNGESAENQFIVSWRTPQAESGQVQLADGQVFEDVRGADYRGKTHYVLVNNLRARTMYKFDIISGGTIYDNGGGHWSVRVGAAVQPATPYVIFGRVKNPDGSEADGAIVYAQLRDADDQGTEGRSALLSSLIVAADGGDFFNINLTGARTSNLNQKYVFNPETDRVQIIAVGTQGTASQVFKIADIQTGKPPASLILSSTGTGSAATATPTQTSGLTILPTLTPTSTSSPIPTETPLSPTPTETAPLPTETLEPSPTATTPSEPTVTESATGAPAEQTRTAATTQSTPIASAAGEEIEPQRTRISRGVPTITPPPAPANNTVWFVAVAIVLFVGALLLGLAAFFMSRR